MRGICKLIIQNIFARKSILIFIDVSMADEFFLDVGITMNKIDDNLTEMIILSSRSEILESNF